MEPIRIMEFSKPLEPIIGEDGMYNIIRSIQVKIENFRDELVYQEVVKEAMNADIDELILMDKNFVLEALMEKLEREKGKENGKSED